MIGVRYLWVAVVLAMVVAAHPSAAGEVRDLYFGEALYDAYQGQYFEALTRLDVEIAQHGRVDEPELDSLQPYMDQADFSVGDFELDYRMQDRARRTIQAALEANVDPAIRNTAAFRLARLYFEEGRAQEALEALARIRGQVPPAIRDDTELLRGNVYLALGRPADAVAVLERLQHSGSDQGFAAYNLGIALLQAGRQSDGLRQLDKAGQLRGADAAATAVIDKSSMLRGTLLMRSGGLDDARRSFDRVRLQGPYSNEALLDDGWAYAGAQSYRRALVPWGILAQRDATDPAVQQAKLALPYAYAKLHIYGRAALLYGQALTSFDQQLVKVNASIRSIRAGVFLKALVREEIEHDRLWVVRLRSLPDAPETFYLTDLMASAQFQTALQNYLDLEDLRRKLTAWQGSLDAFQDMVRLRRANYTPLLPQVDARLRELDSEIRLRTEQRDHLDERLHAMLTAPRPDLLATADERLALIRIARLESALRGRRDPQSAGLRERISRLRGTLTWKLYAEYPDRLTQAFGDLRELNGSVVHLQATYVAYVRTRQAAVHSYMGYDQPIDVLRTRVSDALQRVNMLMGRQGDVIEEVAIEVLQARGKRLETFETQARYAVADSYDRATKAQGAGGR